MFSGPTDYGNLMNLTFNYYDSGAVLADPEAEDIKQSDFSFIWSINQRWGIIGRWGFDLEQQRSYDNILGFEYESCCWRARRWARRRSASGTAARHQAYAVNVEPSKSPSQTFSKV